MVYCRIPKDARLCIALSIKIKEASVSSVAHATQIPNLKEATPCESQTASHLDFLT